MKIRERDYRWYPLDNAARIFPPIASAAFPTTFRLSATLHRPVSMTVIRRVAADLAVRFSYFRVILRRGVFWYYLEERPDPFPVEADLEPPCSSEPMIRKRPELLRIFVRGRRIAVEYSHILTDGTGAKEFFRSLLFEYLVRREGRLRESVDREGNNETALRREARELGILTCDGTPEIESEVEYAYRAFYTPRLPKPVSYVPAWHVPGKRLPNRRYHVTTFLYDLVDVKAAAHKVRTGITEYLIAVFLYALQQYRETLPPKQRSRRRNFRPLRILVPVDMRPSEESGTMRNFFVYLMVELDIRLGHYELAEIARKVFHQMGSEIDPRNLRRHVTRNVRPERNPLVRIIPNRLKDVILRRAYRRSGERANTASFSNLMVFRLPKELESAVDHVDFLPPASPITGVNATLLSFNDTVSLSFGSRIRVHEVERIVAETLKGEGVEGRLITNWGWER